MSKNLGQLTDDVLEQVERICGSCDVDVTRRLNNALLELAVETKKYTSSAVPVVNGEGMLPVNCLYAAKVYRDGVLMPRNKSDSQNSKQAVAESCWFVADNKLKILPLATGSYELLYIPIPATLINDDDVPVFEGADEYLINYAIWKSIADIDGLDSRALFWQQEAERAKGIWKKLNDKSNDRPRFVKRRIWT